MRLLGSGCPGARPLWRSLSWPLPWTKAGILPLVHGGYGGEGVAVSGEATGSCAVTACSSIFGSSRRTCSIGRERLL